MIKNDETIVVGEVIGNGALIEAETKIRGVELCFTIDKT